MKRIAHLAVLIAGVVAPSHFVVAYGNAWGQGGGPPAAPTLVGPAPRVDHRRPATKRPSAMDGSVTAARSTMNPASPAVRGQQWAFIGEGLTAKAYTDGRVVKKQLNLRFRGTVAALKEAFSVLRRDGVLGRVVPATSFDSNGVISQPFARGLSLSQVPPTARPDANRNMAELVARANRLNIPGGWVDKK